MFACYPWGNPADNPYHFAPMAKAAEPKAETPAPAKQAVKPGKRQVLGGIFEPVFVDRAGS